MGNKQGFRTQFFKLDLIGQILCWMTILIPVCRVYLYPAADNSWNGSVFTVLISLAELIFICVFILNRRAQDYVINHLSYWGIVAFIIWAIVALWTVPNMINQSIGILVTSLFFIHFLFFFTLTSYLKSQPQASQYLIYSLVLSGVLMQPFFWVNLYFIHDQIDFNWSMSLPGFGNVRHLGYYLGSLIVLLALLPLIKNVKNSSLLLRGTLFFLLLCGWLMLFWSGGRGSALSAVCTIGVCLMIFRPHSWKKIASYNLSIFLGGFFLSLFLPEPNESYGVLRFFSKITDVNNLNEFSAGRMAIWQDALQVWLQNIMTGIGAGQTKFVIILPNMMSVGQVHNVFLQALMAWGILGGGAFLLVIFISLWKKSLFYFKAAHKEPQMNMVGFGLALSLTLNAFVDGTLYYPFPFFLFIIGLSITFKKE
jgi:hypothetical protein